MNRWGKPPGDIGAWYIAEVKNWCAKSEGTILVAEGAGGGLLGYACHLNKCEEEGADGDIAYVYALVDDLVVTRKARGQGIGRALLAACESMARAAERKVLRIGVLARNESALRVYLSFGFTPHHLKLEKILE